MRRSNVGGLILGLGLCAALGCSSQVDDTLGHKSAAAGPGGPLPLEVLQYAPPSGYVGTSMFVFDGVYNNDGATHADVTLKVTIAGSFTSGALDVFGYDPSWACTSDGGTPLTITCHADQITAKDTVDVPVTPTALGTITVDAQLTEGGVLVSTAHNDVSIIPPGADVGIFGGGGGKVPVGQPAYAIFTAANAGPLTATGTTVDFTLTGPGKIISVGSDIKAPPPGFPPPPPPPGGTPSTTTCTFTDTTATCTVGDLAMFNSSPINVVFTGVSDGVVQLDATIHANESDPVSWNNTTSSYFQIFTPKIVDLAVSMSVTPSAPKFKKPMTYAIVVKNNGPDAATGALLQDFLPPNIVFDTVTTTQGFCTNPPYLWCDLGPLAAGASATITATGTPTEGGTVTNSAYVYDPAWDTDIDRDASNNLASLTTTVSGPNPPVTTTSSEQTFEAGFGAYVDCAHDFVFFSGTMHQSLHTTFNKSSGRLKFDSMNNPSNMKGTGFDTGTKYTATGMTRNSQTFSGSWFPSSYDYEDVFHLVGKGPGADLFVHITNHVTFAADGTPKVTVSKYTYTCK